MWGRSIISVLVASITAFMWSLLFSGADVYWLAWFGFAPFLMRLRGARIRGAFALGGITGLLFVGLVYRWMPATIAFMTGSLGGGWAVLGGFAAYGALYFGVGGVLIRGLWRRLEGRPRWTAWIGIPALWVVLEFLNALLFERISLIFFPMIGYSQWNHPAAIQAAAFTGVTGVSFVLMLGNVAVAQGLREKRLAGLLPAVLAALLVPAFGQWRIRWVSGGDHGPAIRAAVMQPAIDAITNSKDFKGDVLARRYIALSRCANRRRPDLVVWSETAVPWMLADGDDLLEQILLATADSQAFHIVGGTFPSETDPNVFHNSAFLLCPDGLISRKYDKTKMLPGVEVPVRIPGFGAVPAFNPSGEVLASGWKHQELFAVFGGLGVLICNESLYPGLCRGRVREGAKMLVVLSNDGWGRGPGALLWQHWLVSPFRAAECGRDIVIANNSGISGFVDATGRIQAQSRPFEVSCVAGVVRARTSQTFYAQNGDWFPLACGLLNMSLACFRRRRT